MSVPDGSSPSTTSPPTTSSGETSGPLGGRFNAGRALYRAGPPPQTSRPRARAPCGDAAAFIEAVTAGPFSSSGTAQRPGGGRGSPVAPPTPAPAWCLLTRFPTGPRPPSFPSSVDAAFGAGMCLARQPTQPRMLTWPVGRPPGLPPGRDPLTRRCPPRPPARLGLPVAALGHGDSCPTVLLLVAARTAHQGRHACRHHPPKAAPPRRPRGAETRWRGDGRARRGGGGRRAAVPVGVPPSPTSPPPPTDHGRLVALSDPQNIRRRRAPGPTVAWCSPERGRYSTSWSAARTHQVLLVGPSPPGAVGPA